MGDRTWGSTLKVGTGNALLPKWTKFRAITACPRETWSAGGSEEESHSKGAGNGDVKLLTLLKENELGAEPPG